MELNSNNLNSKINEPIDNIKNNNDLLDIDFPEISNDEDFGLFSLSKTETNNMNFKQYKDKVYKDLNIIENQIIDELMQNDTELVSMLNNFNESEEILETLESSLLQFKDRLSDISSDMKVLQSKSNEISIKLKNRKDFEEELFKLLDSIILAPEFLNDLTNKDVEDDHFREKLNKLDEKLTLFIKKGELPECKAVEEIIPEMQKTLAKVCSKIYLFIVNKFQMFQKPNTNIQVIQNVLLNKNKQLVLFLKKHAIVMYNDLINKYCQIMDKIYYSGASVYSTELSQYLNDGYEKKYSLISSDDISILKELICTIQKRKTIILSKDIIDETSIMPIIAKQKQQKFYYEEIFRSINKFLIDIVITEIVFFNEFFDLNPSKSSSKLNEIFKNTLNLINDYLKRNCIYKTNDFVSICLMIVLSFEQSKMMTVDNELNHLEFYFESINTCLWPKFDEVFKKYADNFFKNSFKTTKYVNSSNGLHIATLKLGEFLSLITLVCIHTTQSPMLLSRIKQIQKQFNQFYHDVLDNSNYVLYPSNTSFFGGSKSSIIYKEEVLCIFLINNLYYLLRKIEKFDLLISSTDSDSFNKTFHNKTESFINILFKKYFEDINRITAACTVVNSNILDSKSSNIADYNTYNTYTNQYNRIEMEKLDKNELSTITNNFAKKHKELIDNSKKDIYDSIKDADNAKAIYKKYLQEMVATKYFNFLEILKQSKNEDILNNNNTVSYQKFMIEINNIVKSI